jgi:fumarylpyruvate hydrolase
MTRRDLQLAARERGRPWDTGKNFEESAPMGRIHKAEDVGHISAGRIWLEVNGEVTQDSNISNLIWSVDEIIADLSRYYTLMPGDLIFTGTPDKVGPTVAGDKLVGYVEGLSSLEVSIRERNEVEVLK